MKKLVRIVGIAIVAWCGIGACVGTAAQEQKWAVTGPNYLYIEEFEIGANMVPNEAIAKASGWVHDYRKTGEFKSVKLYIHNTGPRFSLYILIEPKSWQSIETGFDKFYAATPEIMSEALGFGRHTDNILSEVDVE